MNVTSDEPRPYRPVTGWLLVLCLGLTIGYPSFVLYRIIWHTVPDLIAARSFPVVLLLSVYSALFSAVALFSITAGLKLWLIKPGAVATAKAFLVTHLVANIAYAVFWLGLVRTRSTVAIADLGWHHVVGPIASTALWYFYLESSQRVRETYGPA